MEGNEPFGEKIVILSPRTQHFRLVSCYTICGIHRAAQKEIKNTLCHIEVYKLPFQSCG